MSNLHNLAESSSDREAFSSQSIIEDCLVRLDSLKNGMSAICLDCLDKESAVEVIEHAPEVISGVYEDIVIVKSELDRLRRAIRHDTMTGLLNERGLHDEFVSRLAIIRREQFENTRQNLCAISCVYVDINDFKTINDSYGHSVGDEVIRHVAMLLEGSLRANDIIARPHGDEFVVVMINTSVDDANTAIEHVRESLLANRVHINSLDIAVDISYGVATYDEDIGLEDAISTADLAMLQNKQVVE